MVTLDGDAFADFLKQRRNDLRRIVRQSPDRMELEEMEAAWKD